jgi:hypothetical protein
MRNGNVNYKALAYTIGAGETLGVEKQSGFITCLEASAAFKIKFDDGSFSDFEAGLTYSPLNGFNRVDIRNPTENAISVTLAFGTGEINDARVTISAGTDLNVKERVPDVFSTGAAITCVKGTTTLAAAYNPNRKELFIVSPTDADGPIYIGGTISTPQQSGLPLAAGQSLVLNTSAAVWIRNNTGTNLSVSVAEIEFSI